MGERRLEKALTNQQLHKAVKHSNYVHHVNLQKKLKIYNRQQKLVEKELNDIANLRESVKEITQFAHRGEERGGAKRNSRKTQIEKFDSHATQTQAEDQGKCVTDRLLSMNGQDESEIRTKNRDVIRSANTGTVLLARRSKLVPSSASYSAISSEETSFVDVSRLRCKSELAATSTNNLRDFIGGSESRRSQTVLGVHQVKSASCPGWSPRKPRIRSQTFHGHSREPCCAGSANVSREYSAARLTEEESARIKGAFRQIGHPVLAIALVKVLNERRARSMTK